MHQKGQSPSMNVEQWVAYPDCAPAVLLACSGTRYRVNVRSRPVSRTAARALSTAFSRQFWTGLPQDIRSAPPGSCEPAAKDPDIFFGIEVSGPQRWRFGPTEAGRINVPVLSMLRE